MSKVKRAWKEYLPFYKRTHEEYLHSRGLTTDDAIKRDLQDELLKIIGKLTTEDLEQTLSVSDIRESKLYKNISKLLAVPGADEEEIRAREKFLQAFIERVKPALRKKFVVLSKVVKKDEGPKWEHKEISSEDITREDVLEERKRHARKVLQDYYENTFKRNMESIAKDIKKKYSREPPTTFDNFDVLINKFEDVFGEAALAQYSAQLFTQLHRQIYAWLIEHLIAPFKPGSVPDEDLNQKIAQEYSNLAAQLIDYQQNIRAVSQQIDAQLKTMTREDYLKSLSTEQAEKIIEQRINFLKRNYISQLTQTLLKASQVPGSVVLKESISSQLSEDVYNYVANTIYDIATRQNDYILARQKLAEYLSSRAVFNMQEIASRAWQQAYLEKEEERQERFRELQRAFLLSALDSSGIWAITEPLLRELKELRKKQWAVQRFENIRESATEQDSRTENYLQLKKAHDSLEIRMGDQETSVVVVPHEQLSIGSRVDRNIRLLSTYVNVPDEFAQLRYKEGRYFLYQWNEHAPVIVKRGNTHIREKLIELQENDQIILLSEPFVLDASFTPSAPTATGQIKLIDRLKDTHITSKPEGTAFEINAQYYKKLQDNKGLLKQLREFKGKTARLQDVHVVWTLLDLPIGAPLKEIKSRIRKLIDFAHPDKTQYLSDEERKMIPLIREASEILYEWYKESEDTIRPMVEGRN